MSALTISLFGSMHIERDETTVPLPYDKVGALLAYLLVAHPRPVRRDSLIGLLWPEQTQRKARHSLSQALLKLRQAVDSDGLLFVADRHAVRLQSDADIAIDVLQFDALVTACRNHRHAHFELCAACMQRLATAVRLYTGDFLAGLSIPDALAFETWLRSQRTHWRQAVCDLLASLVTYHDWRGEIEPAIGYARQFVELEPWHESMHRRLMSLLARNGQRSLALRQYDICRRAVQEALEVEVSTATTTLRDQIRLRPNFTLHNLPTLLSPLIGRATEQATLTAWLEQPDVRLITLTGIGGIGKTKLATAIATQFINSATQQPVSPFADGIYFVDLTPLNSPTNIVGAIADTLHIMLHVSDAEAQRQQLVSYLHDKKLLLILDNFEHLLAGANSVTELLRHAPRLTILVTSRSRLRIKSEKVMHLLGLREKRDTVGIATGGDEFSAAQTLFVTTAQQIQPAFVPSPADKVEIARICQLVDGIPLAVELAALWIDTLPLEIIAAELAADISLLARQTDLKEARHHSMQAVFQSSWQRLAPTASAVLAKSAVFRGGFTREAAAAVSDATIRDLSSLVRHSLLTFDHANQRYMAHELLRQYAATQLGDDDAPVQQQTHTAHLNFYCALAEEGERQLRGGRAVVWMKRLRTETGNWSAALDWGYVHHPEVAARLACHLAFFWFSSGQMHIGRFHYQRLLEKQSELSAATRAWTKTWYTALLWPTGELRECEQMAHDTLSQFEKLADVGGIILSYHHLAVAAVYSGDVSTAIERWTQALALADANVEAVSPWFRLSALQGLGTFPMAGREQEAYQFAADTYRLCLASNNLIVGCYAMGNLARLEIQRGKLDEAMGLAKQALAIAQDLNDQRAESIQYLVLGNIALAQRDFATAVEQLEIARHIGETVQNNDILDEATMLLGRDAYTGLGAYDRAFAALQSWAKICLQMNNEPNMATCLERLAGLYWQLQPANLDSVRWAATAAAWRAERADSTAVLEESYRQKLIAVMHSGLTAETFRHSWQAGLKMPLNETLRQATTIRLRNATNLHGFS